MTPSTASLLTIAQLRANRDALSERELLNRCRDAARLELRGAMFSPDDRLDVASRIMLDGLALTDGATPSAHDPKHSLGAYCKRAQTARRSIERDRDRDTKHAEQEADAHAWSARALEPDVIPVPEVVSPETASEAADIGAWRLSKAPHSVADGKAYANLWRYLYGVCRDMPGPVVAAELGLTPNAYDVACSRARVNLRTRYPDAADLLRALADLGAPVTDDASRAAHDRTHALAQDWREGTDAGSWPTRPLDAEQAREVCRVTYRRAAPVGASKAKAKALRSRYGARKLAADALTLSPTDKGAPRTPEQAQADALRRLSYALGR